MPNQRLTLASGDAVDIRQISVEEALSTPFQITVTAVTTDPDLDLATVVGDEATLAVEGGRGARRTWTGVVSYASQLATDEGGAAVDPADRGGLCTYSFTVVPRMWLTTLRRNHRIFQNKTIPDIVEAILADHRVSVERRLGEAYPCQLYRVQYGETDFVFLSRLLAEEGISYMVSPAGVVVLLDQPQSAQVRPPLPYLASVDSDPGTPYVTDVQLGCLVRSGRHTIRDFDFDKPDYALFGEAALEDDDLHEQYFYEHGAFTSDEEGARRARIALAAHRGERDHVRLSTNVMDLAPGAVISIEGHARGELGNGRRLLVLRASLSSSSTSSTSMGVECVFADDRYCPPQRFQRPTIHGVQSAVVVGPEGEEIHTDEHGRVKVQFHWDREGQRDENSSCWLRVSQGWAGAGFGMLTMPRIGQEVIVSFWEGNPDQPVVTGRLYNATQALPHALPEHATRSTLRSRSTPAAEGFNEIYFEDRAGEEVLYLHAQRDRREVVERNADERTGGDRRMLVGGDSTSIVRRDDATLVGESMSFAIARVGADGELEASETQIRIEDGAISLTTGQAHVCLDGPDITLKADRDITLSSGGEVLIHGGPYVKINC